ncbi:MAG: Zn-dependent exopeptidase M28 [Planctomycetes bacterium]|nr:Zn-dependent exopeptidase M28 [Planctomycetota bacterium]
MSAFNARRALDFATSISRPRLCGTAEERAVAGEVRRALTEAGWEVEEEFFEFRPVADNLLRFAMFLTHLGLAAVGVGLWKEVRLAYGGLAFLLSLAVFLPWFIRRTFHNSTRDGAASGSASPGRFFTSNLAARAPGPADGPLFVFMAHYDSKSQSLSLAGRIALFRWARTAAFCYLGVALARLASTGGLGTGLAGLFSEAVPFLYLVVSGAAVFALSLPLYLLRTHNHSPGAMDNASGVGALVEMARIWKTLPAAKKSRAVFLAVSGEEFGMIGSQTWVRRHRDELRGEKRLRVLNFDGVGYAGPVRIVPARGPESGGVSMSDALVRAGKSVGIDIQPIPPSIGLMTDHASFTRERLACATLLTHSWAAKRLHTPDDAVESLKVEGFERVGKIALRVVDDLAAR